LLLLEEADAFGRFHFFSVGSVMVTGENFDGRILDGEFLAVGGNGDGHLPVACLGKSQHGLVNTRACGCFFELLNGRVLA
jgi:hypothetical protein